MIIKTDKESLLLAIYEGLNNLDFALSNDEIESVQRDVFKELKIDF